MHASLKQLRYFVTIAECGKLSEASKRLHISQPALSAALSQLEDIWETQLFIRHKAQGVSLTASGELLLRHSRQLLQQAHSLDDYARELNLEVSGEIHIGCFSTLAPLLIPQMLQQAREQYPELTVHVVEGDLVQLNENLLNGRLELALSYGMNPHERLQQENLLDCLPYVVLPKNHKLAAHAHLTLAQLADEPMILLDLPHSRDYFLSMFERLGLMPRIVYRSTNFEMVRSMVAAELGFSLLNQRPHTHETYNGGEVIMVPLATGQAQGLMIVIARHNDLKPSVRAEAVMKLLRDITLSSAHLP